MAASKLVLILPHVFEVQLSNATSDNVVRPNYRQWKIEVGGI